MIKRLAVLLVLLHFSVAYSQTIKTDVLVIGGTPSGVAAAVQSARSKVKTVLVEEGKLCQKLLRNGETMIPAKPNAQSGISMELIGRLEEYYKKLPNAKPYLLAQFKTSDAAMVLTQIADTVKNLTIDTNAKFISIKKDNDRWIVVMNSNGKIETLKPRVVIDATENTNLLNEMKISGHEPFAEIKYENEFYRTSVASITSVNYDINESNDRIKIIYMPNGYVPLLTYITKRVDNFLEIHAYNENFSNNLFNQLAIGQGAGATAAYCAFFKTTTANLKPRIIQGELLDFKAYLLPLTDINGDPYWRAIQQICATGLLRGKSKMMNGKQQFVFMPDSIVTTAEVKPVLLETYTRAFLWFNAAKPGKEFTVGNLLSFISELTLTDPDVLQKKIEKEWSEKFKFQSAFDMQRPITRREFAILANQYLNPFGRAVDLDGRVVN